MPDLTHAFSPIHYALSLALSLQQGETCQQQKDIEDAYLASRIYSAPGVQMNATTMDDLWSAPRASLTRDGRIMSILHELFSKKQAIALTGRDGQGVKAIFRPDHFVPDMTGYLRNNSGVIAPTVNDAFANTLKALEGQAGHQIVRAMLDALKDPQAPNVFLDPTACRSVMLVLAWFNDAGSEPAARASYSSALAAILTVIVHASGCVPDSSIAMPTSFRLLMAKAKFDRTPDLYTTLTAEIRKAIPTLCKMSAQTPCNSNADMRSLLFFVLQCVYAAYENMSAITMRLGIHDALAPFPEIRHALDRTRFLVEMEAFRKQCALPLNPDLKTVRVSLDEHDQIRTCQDHNATATVRQIVAYVGEMEAEESLR